MASSKVWRKGRWVWECNWENGSSCFEDFEACKAASRLTYSSKEEAEKAGRRHRHTVTVWQIEGKTEYKQICVDCSTKKEVTFAPCPYDSDLHGNYTKVWLCEKCRNNRAHEL